MRNLRTVLEDADPVRREPPVSMIDARAIRRAMLAEAQPGRPAFFPGAVPVAALVVLMIAAGALTGRKLSVREPLQTPVAPGAPVGTGERRQVQFATPGGTRIIWTINPEFQLGEVMP